MLWIKIGNWDNEKRLIKMVLDNDVSCLHPIEISPFSKWEGIEMGNYYCYLSFVVCFTY